MSVLDATPTNDGALAASDVINTTADSDSNRLPSLLRPVVVKPHPFSSHHQIYHVPIGITIRHLLSLLRWQDGPITDTVVKIDGIPVPPDRWEWVVPSSSQHVTVMTIPQGGGGSKGIGQIILGIALIAASVFVPEAGIFALGIATPSFVAGIGFSFTLAGVAGLISPLPNLPRLTEPSVQDSQNLVNAITGTQNRANPFGSIPRVFGTHRMFPPLAAVPFTEIVGNDQYLVMLFCFGYGPVDISSERIGNTDISNFSDVTGAIHNGFSTPTFSIYTHDVNEDRFDILLTNAAGWQTQTTVLDTEQISVDFTYPKGVVAFDEQGNRVSSTVSVDVEYRLTGSTGAWTPAGTVTVTDKTSNTVRRTLKFSVSKGQYDVRCRRTTSDPSEDSTTFNEVRWTILRSFKMTPPVKTTKPLAYKELRIRATNQLNGVIDQYNALVKSYLQVYDGSGWILTLTNNPAWAYVSVLTDSANAKALSLLRIHANDMKSWADWCSANGFTYNRIVDTRMTVFDLLREIASAGRAAYHIQDGLYTVVRDVAQTVPIQHFSPRNVIDYSGERLIKTAPHALRIPFLNEEIDYLQDERIVYDDGYDENNATDFESLEFRGVTNKDQIWKLGRYHIAQARLRRESHLITTDVEFIECTRGDLVAFVHDVVKFGLGSARITQVEADGNGNVTGIHFDEVFVHEASKSYAVRIRKSDGTSLLENVNTVAGKNKMVTFSTAIPSTDPQPQVGDLVLFGEQNSTTVNMLVSSITPKSDLTAQIRLVNEAPGVLTADSGPIPPFNTNITQPSKFVNQIPPKPVIVSIRSDESVLVRDVDGSLKTQMVVSLELSSTTRNARDYFFQVQYRILGSTGPWSSTSLVPADQNEVVVTSVEDGETYEIRARAVTGIGFASDFTPVITHTVVGKTTPPPDVQNLMVARQPDGTREFSWEYPNPPKDHDGFVLKYRLGTGWTWSDLYPLHSGLILASPFETNQLAAGQYTFAIKAVDTSGNESANAVFVTSTIGDPRLAGAVYQESVRASQWPGTKTSCWVDDANDLVAVDTKTWDDFSLDLVTWDGWTVWPRSPASPIIYEHPPIDLGASIEFAPLVTFEGTGTPTLEMSTSDDGTTYTGWTPLGRIQARYIKIRATITGSSPKFTDLRIILDASAIIDEISDLDTSTLGAPAGDFRVPLNKSFSVITSVALALQNVGSGWSWEVIDKDPTLGPRIKIYNGSGVLADATVDIVVRGVA